MDRIIAGRFPSKKEADAVAVTMATIVNKDDICIFHNNPPGQHDALPLGGDEKADPDAGEADESAAGGVLAGAIAGGAVGALAGPVGALAGAGVGAYSGSLVGAMSGLEDKPGAAARRPAGVMLSVRIGSPKSERLVISTLRKGHAKDIEQAEGTWSAGDWKDFDPVAAPNLVKQ